MVSATTVGRPRRFENDVRIPKPATVDRSLRFVTWLVLVGIFSPAVPIHLGEVTFTPGRIAIFLLFVPALRGLLRKGRSRVASDYFAAAVAVWMLCSSILNGGFRPFVIAEALEFLGAYLVGRAFFFGRPALQTFIHVFKIVVIVVIMIALLDTFSGRNVTMEFFGIGRPTYALRLGFMRAASTFEGYELYGTFCLAAVAILLYSERGLSRIIYVGIAMFGLALSLSSGPLLGLFLVMAWFCYDFAFPGFSARWQLLIIGAASCVFVIFIVTNNPVGWMIRNLTLDPQTGYFRVAEWKETLSALAGFPWIGHGMAEWQNVSWAFKVFVADQGIDCVWLVEALRYGYPVVALLLLTIVAPFWTKNKTPAADRYMDTLRTGFSFAIISMSLIGLTVHYWDSVWIFFSLCIGIRASFAEFESRRPRPAAVLSAVSRPYHRPVSIP